MECPEKQPPNPAHPQRWLRGPAACVENIEYHPERRMDREQILRLASCTYLQEAHNVIIPGATGAGKTYLA